MDPRAKVRDNLSNVLGPPGEVWRAGAIEIAYFAPERDQRHAVIATFGVAEAPDGMLILQQEPSGGALLGLVGLLAEYAAHATERGRLEFGDVVPAASSLASLCAMQALLLVPPIPLSSAVERDLDHGGDVAWLLPLFAAEVEHARSEGAASLMARFALANVDPTDLLRPRLFEESPPARTASAVHVGEIEIQRKVRPRAARW
jgi:hypothetical protein